MTRELNGTGQLGSQKHFPVVAEWAQFRGKRGNSAVIRYFVLTLVFFRFELSVWGLFKITELFRTSNYSFQFWVNIENNARGRHISCGPQASALCTAHKVNRLRGKPLL